MSKIHLEIFDTDRNQIFQKLSLFRKDGYLAGGTALALQINHRKSFDFDIFIEKPVGHNLKKRVEQVFGKNEYYINTGEQISFKTIKNIGITFVTYYFKPLFVPIKTTSISLASIKDIAADKAHTIGRRAVWRDYVDFYFLLKWNLVTLTDIINHAQRKFGYEFIKTQFLEQLVYFKDLNMQKIDFLKVSYTDSDIQSFLVKKVEDYLKKILP